MNKKNIILIIALVILIGVAVYILGGFSFIDKKKGERTAAEQEAYERVLVGFYEAFNQNDLETSVTEAQKIIHEYPDDIFGYLALAAAYLQQGETTGQVELYTNLALEQINLALELNPNSADAYRMLAHIHERRMEFDEAFAMFNKAHELNPFDDTTLVGRGHLYYVMGNDILAEQDFKKALEINSENSQAITNLALLYMRTGRYRNIDVEEMFLRAIQIEKNHNFLAEAYNGLGVFYMVSQHNAEAAEMFEMAVNYDSGMVPSWNGIAMANIYQLYEARDRGDVEGIEKHLTKALQMIDAVFERNPRFSRGYLTQGIVLGFAQDYEAEKAAYEKGLMYVDTDTTLGMQEKEQVRQTFTNLLSTF